ncbi:MAG: DUF4097 domain-containing protein [Oscillospiraceae bacterium]|nr:DUF4097 domain-containing protein [Oscillospiraceae bacterium]
MFKKKFRVKLKANKKIVALITLLSISLTSAVAAVLAERRYGDRWDTRVYRAVHVIELHENYAPELEIYVAGMAVEIAVWEEAFIKVECVAELPLIIIDDYEPRHKHEIRIAQDDGFAISFMTADLFRYHLKVYLPRGAEFKRLGIVSAGGSVTLNAHHLRVREEVNIATSSGQVNLIRPTSVYNIRTHSGGVNIDFDYLISEVIINSLSGDLRITLPDTLSSEAVESLLQARTLRGELVIIAEEKTPLV